MNRKKISQHFSNRFPIIWHYLLYRRAFKKLIKDESQDRIKLFNQLIDKFRDRRGLQIGVRREKFASGWTSVDLYDHAGYIDFNYDVVDLKFADSTFDVVVCNAVLEHVPDPAKAISEMHRVLKSGGEIWVEIPFNQPYHPSPQDYWRVTHSGLTIWMKDFEPINCGYFLTQGSPLHNSVFFHGRKK